LRSRRERSARLDKITYDVDNGDIYKWIIFEVLAAGSVASCLETDPDTGTSKCGIDYSGGRNGAATAPFSVRCLPGIGTCLL
jgi:hypothetical protein